jgi:hypothetical protein
VVAGNLILEFQNFLEWLGDIEEGVLHLMQSEILQFITTQVTQHIKVIKSD